MLEQSVLDSIGVKHSARRQCNDEKLLNLFEPNEKKLLLALDTEDNSKGKTFMCNFFDGLRHYTFRNTDAAVEFLERVSRAYKQGVEVWTANAQYDVANLYRTSQESLGFNIVGSRVITGRVMHLKIKFKDILNVIPGASVKKIGKMINFEKIEVQGEFDNEEYCQRDTEIVFWGILKFKSILASLGIELKNTASSTGFTALIKEFEILKANNFSQEEHEFMRAAYKGGRTEVFNTAKQTGEIYGYDIVSSYPACMANLKLPNSYQRYFTKKPNIDGHEGIVECVMECPLKLKIPYLPVKYENKLIFPTGTIYGSWTYFEIREAKKIGYKIKKILNAIEFRMFYDYTMTDFVNTKFDRRAIAKEQLEIVLSEALKVILNGSYGKLAMGNERSELAPIAEMWKHSEGSFEAYPNGQILVKTKTKYPPTTNYYLASMITAMGRHNVYKRFEEIVKIGGELLYCDTDSAFYKGPKLKGKNINTKKLGSFGLEHELSECQFILPKTYYIKWNDGTEKYKCKGVKHTLAKDFFLKGYVQWMSPLKYVETCRKNLFISERNKKFKTNEKFIPFNLWINKPKRLKASYTKRIKLQHGATKPLSLHFDIESGEYL